MDVLFDSIDLVNWWAVLLATVATLPIGFIWYDLRLGFGKRWAELVGLKESELQSSKGMGEVYAAMLISTFLTALLIVCLQLTIGIEGFFDSLVFGAIIGTLFRGGAHVMHDGFERASKKLTLINTGHDVLSITVMSVVLGVIR